MAQPYRFLEHRADILFEAEGKDFKEALSNSALAMFSVIGKAEGKEKVKEKVKIKEKGENKEQLVVYFLSKLLSEMDTREIVFSSVKIEKLDEGKMEIEATALGENVRPKF
ncbi:archease, partial [Candidatus Micrarchaeota archaeon CG11_big_fil_rev_8_21_14_0_20_47_5]